MKRFILTLTLLAAVAVSGCVTEQDLDQQTQDIRQKIEEEHHSVKKYTVDSVDVRLECWAEKEKYSRDRYNASSADVLERQDEVQEFSDGEILVVDGFEADERYPHHACQDRYDWYRNMSESNLYEDWTLNGNFELEMVRFNYSIYESGGIVHSEQRRCGVWAETWNHRGHRVLEELVDDAYEQCFEVKR